MKIGVSFSLFGSEPLYMKGLHKNAVLLKDTYPDSTMIVHTDQPEMVEDKIPNADVIGYPVSENNEGYFWRFLSYNDDRFDAVLFRDADSVINVREAAAVRDWLSRDLPLYASLDHVFHFEGEWPVMAGMWGARKGSIPFDFKYLVEWWVKNNPPFNYTSDQWFLRRYIWPLIASGDGVLYNRNIRSRWRGEPWPEHEPYESFVGARISQ